MDFPDASPRTLPAVLDAALARDPAHPFLRCDGRELTTGDLDLGSRRVAQALLARGIVPGDRVAVMMANVPEFLDVWFGIVRARAIEVPVHSAYRGPLLEHILAESGARILFCDAEFLPRLAEVTAPDLERVIVRGTAEDPAGAGAPLAREWLVELDPPAADLVLPAPDARDVTCLLYTSGTTGPSKGVVLSHTANLALARANVALMEYTERDVLYTAFPLFHVNAKFTSVVSTLLSGARLVLDDRFSASRFWARMREERVTSFNYMGTMLTVIAKQPPGPGDREHRVDRCYGGAVDPSLWEPFQERFGVRLHEHYGMTEIGIAIQNTRTDRRVGSIGRAAPHLEVRLGDPDDYEPAVGEVGEILVRPRSPDTILREYWQRPEATVAAFRNLWFHTGDRARMDADGFFYYVDRLKDSIRRRGENVSSFEVESVVNAHPSVVECAAYGVPSELGEDDVMVAVVVTDPAAFDPSELVAHCRARLAYFAVPRYLRIVGSLPKTASERVQKFKLREVGVTAETFDVGPVRRPAARPGRSTRP
ncbi:MAG TPA: AMP-binding protein [Solirubrobacteraceae bacterium]|nr:AMP-binding protein [Solirubrobacteraceae bacterium]